MMTCGFEDALSRIVTVPCFIPCVCGEKVTLMLQFAPEGTVEPQVEVMPNWPVIFMEEIFSGVAPVLVRVTVCGRLVVPCCCLLKFRGAVGEKATTPVFSRTCA